MISPTQPGDALPPLPVAVVVPCYKVRRHILGVIAGLAGRVDHVYVVDDACPEHTGRLVQEARNDAFVTVIFHASNQGVGGAVITGYRKAIADGHDIVVKMDGDGQMDPADLPAMVAPLLAGEADYAKGNRFFDLYSLDSMPLSRLVGNAGLSFISKFASGYWDIMDPTNGYTAIHRTALEKIPLAKLARRYFFESDMLFRLATLRAVVRDVPMAAIYGDESSNLRIWRVLRDFPPMFLSRIVKRFFYMYMLRDFNAGSVETIAGCLLLLFGLLFGGAQWIGSIRYERFASTGTVMIAVLPIVIGVQLLLSAMNYDINNRPDTPLQRLWPRRKPKPQAAPIGDTAVNEQADARHGAH